jgi:hypothetical protein
MQNTEITKPVDHIQVLIDSFLQEHRINNAKEGQKFPLVLREKRMCLFLVQGRCNIKRVGDSMIISRTEAPSIIGLNDLGPDSPNVVIQANSDIKYFQMTREDALRHVEEHHLWKPLAFVLMFISARFNDYLKDHVAIPTYNLICNLLQKLNEEDFETKATVSAAKYILDRTSLSRSGVMKVLSELSKGGYITISRGLLIRINHLPERY